jgi:hypothetical protein
MKLRTFVAALGALLLAAPALAETRGYALAGDNSTVFPTDGTIVRPDVISGHMVLTDNEAGTVTLNEFQARAQFTDIVGGTTTTNIPGTTVVLDNDTTLRIGAGQTGGGSIYSSVDWDVLTNWTQTGRLYCNTRCPGGCGGANSCIPFVHFDGTGPPAPLKASSFNTDPWSFDAFGNFVAQGTRCMNVEPPTRNPSSTSDADAVVCDDDADCSALSVGCVGDQGDPTFPCACVPTIEVVFLPGVNPAKPVRANTAVRSNPVPAVPLLGVAGLGAALLYLGARAIRRRSR